MKISLHTSRVKVYPQFTEVCIRVMGKMVLLHKGKYHSTADLLFYWFWFSQTGKSAENFNTTKQLNRNRRSAEYVLVLRYCVPTTAAALLVLAAASSSTTPCCIQRLSLSPPNSLLMPFIFDIASFCVLQFFQRAISLFVARDQHYKHFLNLSLPLSRQWN